jgi:hypothetical protein
VLCWGFRAASDTLDRTQLFDNWNSFQELVLALASRHISTISHLCVKRSGVKKALSLYTITGTLIHND